MEDIRSDETLVEAFYNGIMAALNILFIRYYKPVFYYILKQGLVTDDSFLDDVRQEIFLKVFTKLKSREFKSSGAGSFRAWFYTIALNICRNCNYYQMRQPVDIYGTALDFIRAKPVPSPLEEEERQTEIKAKVDKILSKLTDEEKKLMFLITDGKTYKQIKELPEFNKFSIDYLMRKVYLIRKKISKKV
jgi:RNA polymerase sigma factor (sigma-70 family)